MLDNPKYIEVDGENYVLTSYACEQIDELAKDIVAAVADNVLKFRPDDRELYDFIIGIVS